jgi:hypothetical protein
MQKYSGPEDVFKELVEESIESWLFGLVAFAVVEEQRFEWMKHHESLHGKAPSQDEVRKWYEQQPSSVLLRAKGTAENALQLYASEVVGQVDEQHRKEIADGMVIREIKDSHRFGPQFTLNFLGGFTSTVAFAVLLTAIAFLVFHDVSPVSIGARITGKSEVTQK